MFTLRNVPTTSCSVRPLSEESPMKRMIASQNTQTGHIKIYTHITSVEMLQKKEIQHMTFKVQHEWSNLEDRITSLSPRDDLNEKSL